MILTLLNLPNDVKYSDLRELVHSKCGIQDIILDNLISHENRTKKVTIGLAGEADAAIFMRKINGLYFRGRALEVVPKTKQQSSNSSRQPDRQQPAPLIPSLMQNVGQGFNWQPAQNFAPQGQNLDSQGNFGLQNQNMYPTQNFGYPQQNFGVSNIPPAMVPAPEFCPQNMMNTYANQSAYYLMNQPAYQPTQSTANVGYNTFAYGNQNTQQNTWSSNNINEREQNNLGFEAIQQNTDKQSQGNRGTERSRAWRKNRETDLDDNRSSVREDNRGTPWEDSHRTRRGDQRNPEWDDKRRSDRNNDRASVWEVNRDSNTNKDFNQKDNNRDQRFDNNRESSRYNDSMYTRRERDRKHPPSTSLQINEDRSRDSFDRSSHQGQSRWDQTRSSADQGRERNQSPSAKRPRFSEEPRRYDVPNTAPRYDVPNTVPRYDAPNTVPRYDVPNTAPRYDVPNTAPKVQFGGPVAKNTRSNDHKPIPNENIPKLMRERPDPEQINIGKMWRTQLSHNLANKILADKKFVYTGVDSVRLHDELKIALRARVDNTFRNDYSTPIKQLEKIYNAKYNRETHWVLLRDTLAKLGGELVSQMREAIVNPKKKMKLQKAPLVSGSFGTVFGNIKIDRRFEPPQQYQRGKNAGTRKQTKSGNKKKANNTPRALIPGRIPQFPQGDKQLFIQQKKQETAMYTNEDYLTNIMHNLKPAVKSSLEKELDLLAQIVAGECNDPTNDPKITYFCEKLKKHVPQHLKKVLKISLTKRIIPLHPVQIRVFTSKNVKRVDLERLLAMYKVTCVRKASRDPYYVAVCDSVESHDRLCLMEPALQIGTHLVRFKPFHMAGLKGKYNKNDILAQRKNLKDAQERHSAKTLGLTKNTNTNSTKVKDDIREEEESLQRDIKDLCDEINADIIEINDDKPPIIDIDNIEETVYSNEELVSSKEEIVSSKEEMVSSKKENYESSLKSADLTTEANINEIMENLNEGSDNDCLPVIEDKLGDGMPIKIEDDINESDKEAAHADGSVTKVDAVVDDVDWADVNEDDLEDW